MSQPVGVPDPGGAAPLPARVREVYQKSLDCVHCGLCLPACPTYLETGREVSSPRGRVYLMRSFAEGRIPLARVLAEEAYLCLGCRACETACPSGVRFGTMLEQTRVEIEARSLRRGLAKRIESLALRALVPHRSRLSAAATLLRWAQALALPRLVRPLLRGPLRELLDLLPAVPPAAEREPLALAYPAEGGPRGRVAVFEGCVMRELYGRVNHATARVLAKNGFAVVVPALQTCCGALQAHAGDEASARRLARANLRAFADVEIDAIVVNSAGCSAAMREMQRWLPGEAEAFAASTRDVCEFLDGHGLRAPAHPFRARVAYDDPCHLVHAQRVRDAPRRLLARVPGVELVTHRDPEGCCGAAGIYNLTHRAMSQAILERKLDALAEVDPDVVATGNPGCLLQLERGVRQRGLRARVMHPVEILDAAYAGRAAARSPLSSTRPARATARDAS